MSHEPPGEFTASQNRRGMGSSGSRPREGLPSLFEVLGARPARAEEAPATVAMDAFSLAFAADVALAAGSIGILWLVNLKFASTTLLYPLALLCGSGCALGTTSALVHLTANPADQGLARELTVTGLIATSLLVPAFAHLLTLYPRRVTHPLVPSVVGLLYVMGLAHAALAPTRLVVSGFGESHGEPVAVLSPTQAFLVAPSSVFLSAAVAWLAYLVLRGRSDAERSNARLFLIAVVPAVVLVAALPPMGWPARHPTLPSVETLAFGWAILFVGGAIYRGWWRPPVPQGLQLVLDASTDAILILDGDGNVSTANQAARDLAGPRAERIDGVPFIEALPAECQEKAAADLLTMSAMGVVRGRIDRNTHEIRGPNPTSRSFMVSLVPVGEGDRGGVRGALVMVRDETDRIALADATARLANLQDLVIRILGHDVKTPIAVIQGYAELAQMRLQGAVDEKGSGEVRRHLEHILEAVTTSQIILSNARAISRLAAGPGAKVEFGALDITRMARQAATTMQPLAHAKGVTLSVDAAPDIYARAPKGFESVFMNLLSNAVKYTPPGGEVDLALRMEDGRAVVRVSDTGPGIDPDQRDRLFAKFERLDADAGKIEGQGLGLSIVASFVDLVGGHVRVEERADGRPGAVFTVEVLASEGNPAPAATSSSPAGS